MGNRLTSRCHQSLWPRPREDTRVIQCVATQQDYRWKIQCSEECNETNDHCLSLTMKHFTSVQVESKLLFGHAVTC